MASIFEVEKARGRLVAVALATSLVAAVCTLAFTQQPAAADPAVGPTAFSSTVTGAFSGVIPDGTCLAIVSALGGTGASSGLSASTGGAGGRAARIGATFTVLPGQTYSGGVGGGGLSNGTAGANGGGAGGTIVGGHRGGGGGGSTSFVVGGQTLIVAGGGGGGGAAHSASPAGNAGNAGTVSGPGVGAGGNGTAGIDAPRTNTGGNGGQTAGGGAGGVNSGSAAFNGTAGGGIGSGTGGNGGPDDSFDSGGGGGAGYTGGGGGSSTVVDSVAGAGGGGGSSFIASGSPTSSAVAPTATSGALGSATSSAAVNGPAGTIGADFIPCRYNLNLTKSASPTAVVRGGTVLWTVSVTNNGPDAMTKGDTIDLTDTLPAGPNGPASPAYKVLSVSTTGGSNADLASAAVTCTSVAVGTSMPSATNCSRPYAAVAGTPGNPSGGTRGLNVGETLTITYEQQISPSATCLSTITNVATVKDRPTMSGTTDIVGSVVTDTASAPLSIGCQPALTLMKALSGNRLVAADQFTTSITPSGTPPTGSSATTTGAGSTVTANTGVVAVSNATAGIAYSFAESMAAGSGSAISQYRQSVTCTNATAGSSTLLPPAASPVVPFAITPALNDLITCTLTNSPLSSSLMIVKSTTSTGFSAVGASIPYSFTVTNTGQTTLQSVTITDANASGIACGATTLAAGGSTTCTATHTVTQADLDSGSVINTASVTGTPPGGSPIPSTTSNTVTVNATQAPALTISKSTSKTSYSTIGETIPYSFTVRNSGNVTISSISVLDPMTTGVSCGTTTLAPGQSTTCGGSHTVTLTDLNNGSVVNTATASATDPGSGSVGPVSSNQVTVPAVITAALSVTKTSSATSYSTLGTSIPFTFAVSNNGNVTMTSVTVSDPMAAPVACLATTLIPGQTTSCSGTHIVTQADLDAGAIVNSATVVGTPPVGPPAAPVASNTVTIPATPSPSMTLTKSTSATSYSAVGQSIPYSLTVTNTGNVTLSSIAVTDPKLSSVTCSASTLAPGAAATCTGNHIVTQTELDAGSVVNTARVAATGPNGSAVAQVASNTVTVVAAQTPTLNLVKATTSTSFSVVGASLPYSFVVSNTGNVTVNGIVVNDAKVSGILCTLTTLAPGQTTTCTGSHTVTQAELDAGEVLNTASVSGTAPGGGALLPTNSNTVTVPAAQNPSLQIVKSTSTAGFAGAGEELAYTFKITNNGNVTISAISVADSTVSGLSCPVSTLAPGESTVCSAVRTTTSTDVQNGQAVNTATVTGTPPNGAPLTPIGSNTVTIALNAQPGLSVVKSANMASFASTGQVVTFTFTVTNIGNVAVSALSVADPRTSGVTCAATSLGVAESTTCTGSHAVTQNDLDAGSIVNTASATATPAFGPAIAPVSSNTVTIPASQTAGLSVVKGTSATSFSAVGSSLAFTFDVTNIGNVSLTGVTVTDPTATGVSCPSGSLAAGATMRCTGQHTVTQADLDAGSVINTASVTGTPPSGPPITPVSSNTVTVPAAQAPQLTVTKTTSSGSFSAVGQSVPFTINVTNTGNVSVTSVTVTDPMLSSVACISTSLAPGISTACTGSHIVTQSDLDNGSIVNTASAVATPPSGTPTNPVSSNSVTVPAVQAPNLVISKSTTASGYSAAGQTIPYTFVVRNNGNVTVTSLAITDPVAGIVSCPQTTLAPLAQVTCTASRTVTQADLDSGAVINTATVGGRAPGGAALTPIVSNTVTVPAVQTATLTIGKSTTKTSFSTVGELIDFSFSVTNTGNVTIGNVVVSDPVAGNVTCAPLLLSPGQVTTCTGSRAATQEDIDAGSVINTATVSGERPDGSQLAPVGSNTVTVPADQTPTLRVVKSASTSNYDAVGDVIDYSFTVTNGGNVTLDNVSLSDPLVAGLACLGSKLAPGDSTTCSGSHAVTQADLDAGMVVNVAQVGATQPNGSTTAPVSSNTVTVPALQAPSVTITKSASTASFANPGTAISYFFLVANTGNVTLTSVSVVDPLLAGISCPVSSLSPGTSTTCSGTHTTTQADLDAGGVVNTAAVVATPPNGTPLAPVASNTVTVPAAQSAALSVTKTPGLASYSRVNEQIPYSFTVTNTGNVTVTDVTLTDLNVVGINCGASVLAPGASTVCTAAHIVSISDLDNGSVTNTASVTGTPPVGGTLSPVDSNTVVTPAVQSPSLVVVKSASTGSFATAGAVITYDFRVTNTGNVTVSSIAISDPKVTAVSCAATTLAVGQATNCVGSYIVLQSDVDAGSVVNTASVVGNGPSGPLTPAPSNTVTVPAVQSPALSISKSSSTASFASVGQSVSYSFVVSNTGNVTVSSIAVADAQTTGVTCAATTLPVASSTTCSGTHVVTQADLDAGQVVNTASVTALDPGGAPLGPQASNTVTVPAAVNPSLQMVKAAVSAAPTKAGDLVDYTFTVSNSGNVTLTLLEVLDPKAISLTCPTTVLAPSEVTVCTGSHPVTQAEVDAGSVDNVAWATARPPVGSPLSPQVSNPISVPIVAAPAATMTKATTATPFTRVGDTIVYTFDVLNTGNVTLTAVTVADPLVGGITCLASSLAPGESTVCVGSHTVTLADLDTGSVVNTATVTGKPPSGLPITPVPSNTVTVAGLQSPALTVVKSSSMASVAVEGTSVLYSFTVTNTGNVTLSSVVLNDPTTTSLSCPATAITPGNSMVCTALHVVTLADLDAGSIVNTASVTATPPIGGPLAPKASNTVTVPVLQGPALSIMKAADLGSVNVVGQTLTYTFVVTNNGNVTMRNIAVVDPNTGAVSCSATTLLPTFTTTCTSTHVVTQADLDAGHVVNTATVTGIDPAGNPLAPVASNSVDVPVVVNPRLTIQKLAGIASVASLGQPVTYSFTVRNTGNVTMSGVAVTDGQVGVVSCPATALAPATQMVCTGTHLVSQGELDAGEVSNTASVVGAPPLGSPITPIASNTVLVPAVQSPSVSVVKSSTSGAYNAVGQTLSYNFTVTNTGNVTVSNPTVTDAVTGAVSCPVGAVSPGASVVCSASRTVSQADLDAGSVINTATATATPVGGLPISPATSNTVTIPAAQGAALTIEKASAVTSVDAVGDPIDYTFTVRNAGNVTITNVVVADANVGPVACPATTLAPGDSTVCTATHITTQADLNDGQVINVANVTGLAPGGKALAPIPSNPVTVTAVQNPALTIVKSTPDTTSGRVEGEIIRYTFVVTNTGNVPLNSILVGDPITDPIVCPRSALEPSESVTCTAGHVVTGADIARGIIVNVATVSGIGPDGRRTPPINSNQVTVNSTSLLAPVSVVTFDEPVPLDSAKLVAAPAENSASTTVPLAAGPSSTTLPTPGSNPSISLHKSAPATFGAVGDIVTYMFRIENTGDTNLTDVRLTDVMVGLSTPDCGSFEGSLAIGESVDCTAQYTVTATDIARGRIDNSASVEGANLDGTVRVTVLSNSKASTVREVPSQLPFTGADSKRLALLSVLLIGLGSFVLNTRRRFGKNRP